MQCPKGKIVKEKKEAVFLDEKNNRGNCSNKNTNGGDVFIYKKLTYMRCY